LTHLSHRLSILYKEYPGDKSWSEYVSSFPDIDRSIFLGFCLDDDIAKAIVWHTGFEFAVKWLTKNIPSLDNKKPIDVMELEEGKVIIRSALMRMP
jgi:hypothetical protein